MYYKNTTQTPNELFDHYLKIISCSQLKVLLTIIRKTTGKTASHNKFKRIEKAWISQKLFCICTNLSGKSVSKAIDDLVTMGLIEVTNASGVVLDCKKQRRRANKLFFSSRLRLESNPYSKPVKASKKAVTQGHTIKLNSIKLLCEETTQGYKKQTDRERYLEIIQLKSQRKQDT